MGGHGAAGSPLSDHGAGIESTRKPLSVMFSDLVGSTALSARMDPEDLREVISAYQKCVAPPDWQCRHWGRATLPSRAPGPISPDASASQRATPPSTPWRAEQSGPC